MALPDFRALGLTGNPFENVAAGSRPDWVALAPSLAEALAARPFRVEVVGEKGAGKSTTLRWYAARHDDARYVYAGRPFALPALPTGGALCLDEANAAPRAVVREAVRACEVAGASLLLSSHWSLAADVPGVRTVHLGEHPALAWVTQRVASFSLAGGPGFPWAEEAAWWLPRVSFVNYGVLRALYEVAENLARGLPRDEARADALRRLRLDATVAPLVS